MSDLDIILERENGTYTALIDCGSDVVEVSRKFGSWQTLPDDSGRSRDVMPAIAAALQKQVHRLERNVF